MNQSNWNVLLKNGFLLPYFILFVDIFVYVLFFIFSINDAILHRYVHTHIKIVFI